MKKISVDAFNKYVSSKPQLDFYFSIVFDNLDYFTIADDYVVYKQTDNITALKDAFILQEFITFIYQPFFESLKDVKLVEGETLDEMFNLTYSNTIRASKDNIVIMLHGGSKELFDTKYEDEVVDRLNQKAYAFFESIDNSADRQVFTKVKNEVIQFIKDYQIGK